MSRYGMIGVLLIAAACSKGSPPHGTTTDSAGVRVVENDSRKAEKLERWTVDEKPAVEIGGVGQGPEYTFTHIAAIQRFSTGEYVILDGAASEFRVFDSQGKFLRKFGKAGDGAGEFAWIEWFGIDKHDSIHVWDPTKKELSVVSSQGVIGRQIVPKPFSSPLTRKVKGIFADGSWLIWTPMDEKNHSAGIYRDSIELARLAPDGASLKAIGRFPSTEMLVADLGDSTALESAAPFPRELEVAVRDSLAFVGTGDEYRIAGYSGTGALRQVIHRSIDPRRVTEQNIAEYRRIEKDRAGPGVRAAQYVTAVDKVRKFPKTMPAHGPIAADREGNLWIMDYQAEMLETGNETRWGVFGPDGVLKAIVVLPKGLSVTHFGSDFVAGIAYDVDGSPRARIYRINRGSATPAA